MAIPHKNACTEVANSSLGAFFRALASSLGLCRYLSEAASKQPIASNQENRRFSGFLPTFGRQEISRILFGLGEILGKTQQPPGFSWLLPIAPS